MEWTCGLHGGGGGGGGHTRVLIRDKRTLETTTPRIKTGSLSNDYDRVPVFKVRITKALSLFRAEDLGLNICVCIGCGV